MEDPDCKLRLLAELTARAQESCIGDADAALQQAHAQDPRMQSKIGKAVGSASRYQVTHAP